MAVVAAFLWLVALAAFYALTEDQPYIQEWIVTGSVAILGTVVVMTAGTKWDTNGIRLPARKLIELATVPQKIVEGIAVVTVAIFRAVVQQSALKGRMQHQPFQYGDAHDGRDIGRRAVQSYLVCVGPNTMLVTFEREKDQILVHVLK